MAPALRKVFSDIQANYTVWIHSETRTLHDDNIPSASAVNFSLAAFLNAIFCLWLYTWISHHLGQKMVEVFSRNYTVPVWGLVVL